MEHGFIYYRQTKHRGKVELSSQVMPVKDFSPQRNRRHPPPLPQFMNLNVNPVDKRTALTYIDSNGNWHRASKGALEQIMNLCNLKEDAKRNIHAIIDKFAEKGPRSLAVARQELGVNVEMITGDQLAIAKETGGRLWMRTNMYPSTTFLGQDKDASIATVMARNWTSK
ncbi:hypothetical protein KIW84_050573 [Lathyrus oleraceus]|uniref:Uncharacterized protein n=1 Tax=Pisum sativum TaxID=3888 RepID=A0A9D4WM11_PEA|nr:hypothetical protein KIW84_050573 [Pisum sativum]